MPVAFVLFGVTLLGVALLHRRALSVAFIGLLVITIHALTFGTLAPQGVAGLANHLRHEGVTIANLFLLLTGFALLARHVEESKVPDAAPNVLPDSWIGGVLLLVGVFVLSAFLDNIAAALIGGTMARHVFRDKVGVGYLAAIVAASNAGGAGSVVGDTTTTMIWISGVSPLEVLHAYVASGVALLIVAVPASLYQQRIGPIIKHTTGVKVVWSRIAVAGFILVAAVLANVLANLYAPSLLSVAPVIGLAVWGAVLVASLWHAPDLSVLPGAAKGAVFLLALVLCASLMPLDALPDPSWQTTFALGAISSVFDNIPLTSLALHQGGYDWGMLAFAVGYGGSMLWFGSSAGVALAGMYPQAKSAVAWVREGWFVPVGYVAGFFALLGVLGWQA
jgi:Na+/H+ antiporter NhaD/arsenite permease-like protein